MLHFGLIGRSLGHSFSKKFFSAKFANEQIDADYELIELDSIDQIDQAIAEHSLSGFNVTIPYKESIIPHLDELSNEAKAVGAVNCVVIKDGRKIGHNTDVTGIEASLEWLDIDADTRALILGTGGASKAVQHVFGRYNIPFDIVSRTEGKGDYTYSELNSEVLAQHNLIVNTTPVGMSPDNDSAPDLCYDLLTSGHRLFDLVYNPAQTRFLEYGKAHGAKTLGGMLMLQTQAIASWHIWQRELAIGTTECTNGNVC